MGNCLKSRKRDDILEQDSSQVSFNQRLLKTTNYEPFEPPKNKTEVAQVQISIEKEKNQTPKEEKAHLESDEENRIYSPAIDQKEQRKLEEKPFIQVSENENKNAKNIEKKVEHGEEFEKKQISEENKSINEEKIANVPVANPESSAQDLDAESIQKKFVGVNLLANDIFSSQPGLDSQTKEELKLHVPVYIPDSNELIQIFEHVTPTKVQSIDLIGQQEETKTPEKSHFTLFAKKPEEKVLQELQKPLIEEELVKGSAEETVVLEKKTEILAPETKAFEQPIVANEQTEVKEVIIEKQDDEIKNEINEEKTLEIVQEKEEPKIESNIEEPVKEIVGEIKDEKIDILPETIIEEQEIAIPQIQTKIEEKIEENNVNEVLPSSDNTFNEPAPVNQEEIDIQPKETENVVEILEEKAEVKAEEVNDLKNNENPIEKHENQTESKGEQEQIIKPEEEVSKPVEQIEEETNVEFIWFIQFLRKVLIFFFLIRKHGGENVFVCGEFTQWNERIRLNKNAENSK